MSSYITTYTRKHFDPVHPDPERIVIEDIAHALSLFVPRKWACDHVLVSGTALYLLCKRGSRTGTF